MNYNTFRIDRRRDSISLDGEWSFGFYDTATDSPETNYTCTIPASGFKNLQTAGLLPDPYYGLNSKLYRDVDKRIYYYRRKFTLPDTSGKDVFLCFEGVSYHCRVFLNGEEIVSHSGMFGGPYIEIGERVRVGENELLVEVTPPAPGDRGRAERSERARTEIVPWSIRRDVSCSNGDFIIFGIWRSVRIEVVEKYHLSRPYLYTEAIGDGLATLRLEVELADPQLKELESLTFSDSAAYGYQEIYKYCLDKRPIGKKLGFAVRLTEKSTGRLAYSSREEIDVYDKRFITAREIYHECQFIERDIKIEAPRLWWPIGMAEGGKASPELYSVELELFDGDRSIDLLEFDTGIRTIEFVRSAGERFRTRWETFQYIINGRPTFIRGMNHMPEDLLFDSSDASLEWLIELASRADIQLLRVWSGGGTPEDDRFYDLCDRYGILIMQDNFPANQTTEMWDRRVLRSQVSRNLYRIRNHPSLAIHTGGNEIRPYIADNDAAMWVISRTIHELDPSRKFLATSPDGGSTHIYLDMEPTWFRKRYGQLPFLAEAGIHCFPNDKSIRQQISREEYERPLSNIFTHEFEEQNPELRNHFTEFIPERVPRMLARASMICDIRGISLGELCEATQLSAHEFYQIMVNSMRENYPITCGIMPWVFKRPWTTVAVQLIDGLGDPTAPYYAVKNAYAPISVFLSLREVSYAPNEEVTTGLTLINDDPTARGELTLAYEVYSPTLELVHRDEFVCPTENGEYKQSFEVSPFTLPAEWCEKYFLLRAVAYKDGKLLNQSVYPCKILERFADESIRAYYRSEPRQNIEFTNGPWLKPQLASLEGNLGFEVLSCKKYELHGERRAEIRLRIDNAGALPIYPIHVNTQEDGTLSYASDNYFFLEPNELRELELSVRFKSHFSDELTVYCEAFNAKRQAVTLTL